MYLYDLSGRANLTSSDIVTIADDSPPSIYNITYYPNTTDALDPDVVIKVNATIVEDYSIGDIYLMYKLSSESSWTSLIMTNLTAKTANTEIIYNASFLPGNGTYIFKINATDAAGNQNISLNYTLVIANDTSIFNSTDIPLTKSFTYSQRSDNNTLGVLFINNTGETQLITNISIASSIASRFNINYTNDDNASYSLASGQNLSLTLLANTTSLSAGLYYYNITIISEAGTIIYEKQLNIQTAEGAYLTTTITKYSSSVTKGQTDIELIASVSNLGTQDATNVVLTWSLPSGFSLTSGSLSRNLGNLPIGSSSTNTIKVSIDSSIADAVVNITADATATGPLGASDYKEITIGSPITVINTVTVNTVSGSGGGSGGGGGGQSIIISKIIEIVHGKEDSFDITIENKYSNSSFTDIVLSIVGYSDKYISISPPKINQILPKETGKFKVQIKIPTYKGYEEILLNATLSGSILVGNAKTSYTEKQYIKLIIQEISLEELNLSLKEANNALTEMRNSGFNLVELEKLFSQANKKLAERKNKEAYNFAQQVIKQKEKAFLVDNLIKKLRQEISSPKSVNIITGNAIFSSKSAEELLDLAVAAFNRGDYDKAEERAKNAEILLVLERKGNIWLFIYLYWKIILVTAIILVILGIIGYKIYRKKHILSRIKELNSLEKEIQNLATANQKNYFKGKVSSGDYQLLINKQNKDVNQIKKERILLRNQEIKILKPEDAQKNLNSEKDEIEGEIKKLQAKFYKEGKITPQEYKLQFESLNERIAEIEEERTTLYLIEKNKKLSRAIDKEIKPQRIGFFKNIFKKIFTKNKTEKEGVVMLDSKVMDLLKEHAKGKNLKGKWIKLNMGKKKDEKR